MNGFIFSKNLHNPEVPGSNPGLATKPVTKVTGFFNATQRRVLAHVSWGALKKTNANRRFVFERLWVRRTCWEDSERSEAGNPGLAPMLFLRII
jgi:hypothetical protein